jgi:predicted dehydrogenase
MDSHVVRWGVLGCADIAIRRVIPAIAVATRNEVVAIASRSLDRAQAAAAQLHIPHAYGSYAELLADDAVDAVYIPLPNSLHAEWTVRAAEHGKHVLCEKPMAPTVAECQQMVSACRTAGVRFMEGFMYRFHPQHARVRALIESGVIGKPSLVRSSFCVLMQRPADDIRFSAELGGGSLMDVGVYAIDAVRWLLGADPVSASGESFVDARGIDLSASAALNFPANVLASVTCSFIANGGGNYEVFGPDGKITVHQAFAQPPGSPARVTWPGGDEAYPADINQHTLMFESFATSLLDNASQAIADDAGIGNIAMIESLRSRG